MPYTKEKLIELINQVQSDGCDYSNCHSQWDRPEHIDNSVLAEHLIANGVTVQEWISVKERLPKYFDHVLINVPGDKPFNTVHEAHLRKDGLWDTGLYRYNQEDVTHWKPMPQPPEGE